jgi:hypothetical protein
MAQSGESSPTEIAEKVGMKPQAISNQLKRLSDRGIIERRREGNQVYYRIVDPCVIDLLERGLWLTQDTKLHKETRRGRPTPQRELVETLSSDGSEFRGPGTTTLSGTHPMSTTKKRSKQKTRINERDQITMKMKTSLLGAALAVSLGLGTLIAQTDKQTPSPNTQSMNMMGMMNMSPEQSREMMKKMGMSDAMITRCQIMGTAQISAYDPTAVLALRSEMKVMFYILWYAPGWEDITAQ